MSCRGLGRRGVYRCVLDRTFRKIIERLGNDWISFLYGMSKHCLTTLDGIHNVYKGLKNLTMTCDLYFFSFFFFILISCLFIQLGNYIINHLNFNLKIIIEKLKNILHCLEYFKTVSQIVIK